jgi:hypothetical protein
MSKKDKKDLKPLPERPTPIVNPDHDEPENPNLEEPEEHPEEGDGEGADDDGGGSNHPPKPPGKP